MCGYDSNCHVEQFKFPQKHGNSIRLYTFGTIYIKFQLTVFSRRVEYKTSLEQHVSYQGRMQLNQSYIVFVNGPEYGKHDKEPSLPQLNRVYISDLLYHPRTCVLTHNYDVLSRVVHHRLDTCVLTHNHDMLSRIVNHRVDTCVLTHNHDVLSRVVHHRVDTCVLTHNHDVLPRVVHHRLDTCALTHNHGVWSRVVQHLLDISPFSTLVFYMQIATCSTTLDTTPGASLLSPCRRHARDVSVPDVVTEQSNITL